MPNRSAHPGTLDVQQFAAVRLAATADRLRNLRAGIVVGDEEAVHRARVELRRLRGDLHVFRFYDHRRTAPLEQGARSIARTLGTIRDRDVIATRVAARAAQMGSADRAAVDEVLALLAAERAAAVEALAGTFLDAYDGLVDSLTRAALDPPVGTGDAAKPATASLRSSVARALRKNRRNARKLGTSPAIGDVHDLRKAVKRTRYAAEALHDTSGRRRDAHLARELARTQDALGADLDDVLTERWLRTVADRSAEAHLGYTAGSLARVHDAARTPRGWRAARRRLRDIAR